MFTLLIVIVILLVFLCALLTKGLYDCIISLQSHDKALTDLETTVKRLDDLVRFYDRKNMFE